MVIPLLVEDGLSILQYADDTILFMDHDLDEARNLKLLLCAFEELSGLKINFHKSELFCFGDAAEYMHLSMLTFLDASSGSSRFGIWIFPYTIGV